MGVEPRPAFRGEVLGGEGVEVGGVGGAGGGEEGEVVGVGTALSAEEEMGAHEQGGEAGEGIIELAAEEERGAGAGG